MAAYPRNMRRWTLIATLFTVGMAVTVAAFARGGEGLACMVSGGLFCAPDRVAEEMLYGGLALVTIAVMSAVVTMARRA
jgi:hypothetical protein